MRLLKSRDAKFKMSPSNVGSMITSIILLVVALKVFAKGLPEIGAAGNEVSTAGANNATDAGDSGKNIYPLVTLFRSDNVLVLAIVGAVLIAVILQVLPGKTGK